MSEQSDKLINIIAKREHQQLKDAVVNAAKAWRYQVRGGPETFRALNDSIDVLVQFENKHKERLDV